MTPSTPISFLIIRSVGCLTALLTSNPACSCPSTSFPSPVAGSFDTCSGNAAGSLVVFNADDAAGLAVVEMGLHDDNCSALEDFVKTYGDELLRPFVFV